MSGADIFTGFMILTTVVLFLFIIMLALPGIIELFADSIIEMKWAIDKVKDALRGDDNGN